jgi:hypothetical protein
MTILSAFRYQLSIIHCQLKKMNHQFKLEKYKGLKSRYQCPACGRPRTFTRYVRVDTGEYLADHVGRCERLDKCQYHYPPKKFYADNPDRRDVSIAVSPPSVFRSFMPHVVHQPEASEIVLPAAQKVDVSYISDAAFRSSHVGYWKNNFVQYLYTLGCDRAIVNRKILQYMIGSSDHWPGATVFWQVDVQGRVRTGKIMLYHRTTGRRVKEPFSHISWVHSAMGLRDFHLQQCLFGEEQMALDQSSPIAIVESEKSAIIASLYRGKELLTAEKLLPLRGRQVTLYPDAGAYELWCEKAKEYRHVLPMAVSDVVERYGDKGMDIADILAASARQG